MAKSFLVSPGRAYLVIAAAGTRVLRTNGTLIDTVPDASNSVSITVDTHEIIVMDNAAKIQQLYNGNSGSNGIMTTAEGETEGTWKIEIVRSLPEEGSPGVIYMLRTTRTGTDRYDDYIWIPADHAYELLGRRPEASSVDLTNVAKTNEENTFTKGQRITGTLYATKVSAPSIDCTDWANFSSLTADIAGIANLSTVTTALIGTVSIQNTLHVSTDASVKLPGMHWQKTSTDQYVRMSIPLNASTILADDSLTVSNMFTLASGTVKITSAGFVMRKGDKNITISDTGIRLNNPAAVSDQPVFSVTDLGEVSTSTVQAMTVTSAALFAETISVTQELYMPTNASAAMYCPVVLGGNVSVQDTLVVKDLVVTGTTTGIQTGGGGGEGSLPDSIPGDFTVGGTLNAGTLLLKNVNSFSPDVVLSVAATPSGTPVFTLRNTSSNGDYTDMVHLKAKVIEADSFIVSNTETDGGLTVIGNLTVPAAQSNVYFQDAGNNPVLRTHAMVYDTTHMLELLPCSADSQDRGVVLETYGVNVSYINTISIATLEDIIDNGSTGGVSTGHISKVWCLQLGSDHEHPANDISVVSPLRTEAITAKSLVTGDLSVAGSLSIDTDSPVVTCALTVVNTLRVDDYIDTNDLYVSGTINTNDLHVDGTLNADVAFVNERLVAPNIETTREAVHSTPDGTADTLCRWAQIGSTHSMLEAGQLAEITLPGPSVQKLPTEAVYHSSVLSLWYQADTSGNDIRLIGTSSNYVKQGYGSGVSNTWQFDNLEIKDEYLGRNLRLLLLHDPSSAANGWSSAVAESHSLTRYIQGRYSSQAADADCSLAASDSGNSIWRVILDAKFTIRKYAALGLTQEQESLLTWLAANKDALANLLASASSST